MQQFSVNVGFLFQGAFNVTSQGGSFNAKLFQQWRSLCSHSGAFKKR